MWKHLCGGNGGANYGGVHRREGSLRHALLLSGRSRSFQGSARAAIALFSLILFVDVFGFAQSFAPQLYSFKRQQYGREAQLKGILDLGNKSGSLIRRRMTDDNDWGENESCGDGDLDTPSVLLDDLTWRVEKLRLEEANKKRFLSAKPRYLPYEECCKWVQSWLWWMNSEKEWRDWIKMGEKRNSYIPARPDEYYGERGEWKGWSHFLGEDTSPGMQSPPEDADDGYDGGKNSSDYDEFV